MIFDSFNVNQPGAVTPGAGPVNAPGGSIVDKTPSNAADEATDDRGDTYQPDQVSRKKHRRGEELPEGIRGLKPVQKDGAHIASSGPPAGTEPLDTSSLWEEAAVFAKSTRGNQPATPAALTDTSRETLVLLLRRLNELGVRFGSGSTGSLTGRLTHRRVEPEEMASLLLKPDEPCWVEGPDFDRRPLKGLQDIRVLDAFYGTRNRRGLPLTGLAMTLDHLAGLGYGLSLVYSETPFDESPGKFGIFQRYESNDRLDYQKDSKLKYSSLVITDLQGQKSKVYYERDVRALAFFEFAAPEEVMGDEIKAARGLRALNSRGMQLYENVYPGHMKEKKLVKISLEKAWDELHSGELGSRPVYVTSAHCHEPQELTMSELKEWHPRTFDAVLSLCPTVREAEEIWVEGEGPLPGHDAAGSVGHLEDLHRRVSARGNPAMGWTKNASLDTAAWAYQVVRGALLENPHWGGALDPLKQYVVELGPYSAAESFKSLPAKLGDAAQDPAEMAGFFTLAAASGSPWQGLELYKKLRETPDKMKLVVLLLPTLNEQKLSPQDRTALALKIAANMADSHLPDESSLDAFSRWERIGRLLPGSDAESLLGLYDYVTEQLREGTWSSFDELMKALGTQALFTHDPGEIKSLLKPPSDGTSVPRTIEQWENDIFINGVRLGMRAPEEQERRP